MATITSAPENELDLAITRVEAGSYTIVSAGGGAAIYLMRGGRQIEFSRVIDTDCGVTFIVPQHVNEYWSGISDMSVERSGGD
jgi:hypothetical protein